MLARVCFVVVALFAIVALFALGACGTLADVVVLPDAGADADASEAAASDGGPEAGADGGTVMTIDLTPSKDAYVEDGASVDANFGLSAQLRVKGNSGGTLDRNTWLSFDVHAFASVTSARLRLSVVSLDTGNTNPVPNTIDYAPTTSDGWSESTLTWNDAPPAGPEVAQTTVTDAEVGTVIEVDVSAAVAADADGIATLVVTSPQGTGRGLTYSSREGAAKPVLRVTGLVP